MSQLFAESCANSWAALFGGADDVTRVTGQKSLLTIQICRSGQTVNLLDTQIGLVEAEESMAIIPSCLDCPLAAAGRSR